MTLSPKARAVGVGTGTSYPDHEGAAQHVALPLRTGEGVVSAMSDPERVQVYRTNSGRSLLVDERGRVTSEPIHPAPSVLLPAGPAIFPPPPPSGRCVASRAQAAPVRQPLQEVRP